jgi:adenine-specific DNA-methyltransferase
VRARTRARHLRASSTDAEQLLWRHLRNRQLEGYKFRRQHPIGPHFADFACVDAALVVEIDGGQHFAPDGQLADARRTATLEAHGFRVLRFDNRQVLTEIDGVLARILDGLHAYCPPHPSPLPQAGEGAEDPSPLPQAGEGAEDPRPLPRAGEGVED